MSLNEKILASVMSTLSHSLALAAVNCPLEKVMWSGTDISKQ
jgi:hypothetical protein